MGIMSEGTISGHRKIHFRILKFFFNFLLNALFINFTYFETPPLRNIGIIFQPLPVIGNAGKGIGIVGSTTAYHKIRNTNQFIVKHSWST